MKLRKMETVHYHYMILIGLSFFFLLFFTKCSPLFLFNDWVDANAYMTMGKGMVHGMVPFRDLFEQKGPVLYLIHAIAYLMSPGTFYGVYVFECIGLSVSLIFMYKISHYYVPKWMALWLSMLLPVLFLAQPYFKYGDSAEEFTVPLMMGLIYTIFTMSREKEKDMKWYFFWQGFSLACVLWIKFTLIGAWIGFFLAVFFICIFHKRFREIGKIILYSMGGFGAATVPWMIYFGIHGALKDLIDVYFVFNMFAYPSDGSFFTKALNAILIFTTSFSTNVLLYSILFFGIGAIILKDDMLKDMDSKIILAVSFACNGFVAFYGGKSYVYYYQVLYPYTSIGLLLIMMTLFRRKKKNPSMKSNLAMTGMIFCYSLALTFSFNQLIKDCRFNTDSPYVQIVSEKEKKEGTKSNRPAQFVFADIMNERENPTMLNYGKIDLGFYTIADILPINKYFERPNIAYDKYPDIMDEQNSLVAEGSVDFIVMRTAAGERAEDATMTSANEADISSKPLANSIKDFDAEKTYEKVATEDMKKNYRVAATHFQKCEGTEYLYWLLERTEG